MLRADIIYKRDPETHARELRPIVSRALAAAIVWWHKHVAKRHFEAGAGGRYKYRPRKRTYIAKKQRVKGHRLPLVYSGDMKQQVLRRIEIRHLKTKPKASGRMRGPRYMHLKPTANFGHDYGAELTATTQQEISRMARLVSDISILEMTKRLPPRVKRLA